MFQEQIDETQQAIDALAEAFSQLENAVRMLPKEQQRKYFNPETFGPISAFLQIGHGYEPACPNCEFHNSDDLIADLEAVKEQKSQDMDDDIQMDEANEQAVANDDVYHAPETPFPPCGHDYEKSPDSK